MLWNKQNRKALLVTVLFMSVMTATSQACEWKITVLDHGSKEAKYFSPNEEEAFEFKVGDTFVCLSDKLRHRDSEAGRAEGVSVFCGTSENKIMFGTADARNPGMEKSLGGTLFFYKESKKSHTLIVRCE